MRITHIFGLISNRDLISSAFTARRRARRASKEPPNHKERETIDRKECLMIIYSGRGKRKRKKERKRKKGD